MPYIGNTPGNIETRYQHANSAELNQIAGKLPLGLLGVIVTLAVAFAVAQSVANPAADAAQWTWRQLGTTGAQVCAALAMTISGLFLVASWPTSSGAGSPTPAKLSVAIALIALLISSAIYAWQYTTAYGRWSSTQQRHEMEVRIARAEAVSAARKLATRSVWRRRLYTYGIFTLFAAAYLLWPGLWNSQIPVVERVFAGLASPAIAMFVAALPTYLVVLSIESLYADQIDGRSAFSSNFLFFLPAIVLVFYGFMVVSLLISLSVADDNLQCARVWMISGFSLSAFVAVGVAVCGLLRPIPDLYVAATDNVKSQRLLRLNQKVLYTKV